MSSTDNEFTYDKAYQTSIRYYDLLLLQFSYNKQGPFKQHNKRKRTTRQQSIYIDYHELNQCIKDKLF